MVRAVSGAILGVIMSAQLPEAAGGADAADEVQRIDAALAALPEALRLI